MKFSIILGIISALFVSSLSADPGIMIDIDIIIHGPTGKGGTEILCK